VVHDVIAWREAATSVVDVGAFRTLERNLIVDARGGGEPVEVAEISASAFRVARVPALLGRTLKDEDERAGHARGDGDRPRRVDAALRRRPGVVGAHGAARPARPRRSWG
jgi:hypothetical protein